MREVEREAHEAAGHMPHRDWCAHCVAGAGREDRRLQTAGPENVNLKPVIAADCGYWNDRGDAGDDRGATPIGHLATWYPRKVATPMPPHAVQVLEGEMSSIGAAAVLFK